MNGPRIAAALALLAVIALTSALGTWQLRRAAEKDTLQAQRDEARRAAPVAPTAGATDLVTLDGRRVVLSGRFDASRTVFLDNRTRAGVAGFHVLTPLELDGGGWVMVLRGWVARDVSDRTRLPALAPVSGGVSIEGFAQAHLAQPMLLAEQARPGSGERLWQRYDPQTFRQWSGVPVVDGVVRQTSPLADGLARDWVEPGSGADKHRAYALQWFVMAAGTAAFALAMGLRARRRGDPISATRTPPA